MGFISQTLDCPFRFGRLETRISFVRWVGKLTSLPLLLGMGLQTVCTVLSHLAERTHEEHGTFSYFRKPDFVAGLCHHLSSEVGKVKGLGVTSLTNLTGRPVPRSKAEL